MPSVSNREKIIGAALLLAVVGAAYLGFAVTRQRAVVAELDTRLERAYRERDDLTRALAAAQKDVRDMDATLAKVQRVLDGLRAAGTVPVVPAAPIGVPPPAAVAATPPTQAASTAKADAERIEAARAEARLLSIALLQAAVDFAGANAGQKPSDPAQLLPYLPPEMAEKLRQLLPEPRKD